MPKTTVTLWLCLSFALVSAYTKETVMVPMRDGVRLVTDIYYPWPKVPPYPVVLTRTPYARYMDPLMLLYLCDLNRYVLVTQSVRGIDSSQGVPALFLSDGWGALRDGYDCIEWIAAQSWCNGKVGMWGASAFGMTQYYAAGAVPPHLVCCMPMIAAPQLYQQAAYNGGEFRKCLIENWTSMLNAPELADTVAAHPDYDSLYYGCVDLARRYDRTRYPMYHVSGWYDMFTDGTVDAFSALAAGFHNQKLFIGPWTHSGMGSAVQGELTYPPNAGGDTLLLLGEMLEWYGYWLKGEQNGIMDRPRVNYYLMGDCDTQDTTEWNHWASADTWPLPEVSYESYYLLAGGLLDTVPPAGYELPDTFRYDPLHPCPTIGGREYVGLSGGYGPRDQRSLESRPDVLVYSTPVLAQPVTVIGKIRMLLYGSSDRLDTDWAVRVCDVYPDGRSMLVTDGVLMARHRYGLDREDMLVPGVPDTFDIDLWSTALVFNAGHRIRVSVTSSNYPRYERNPNTGGPFRRNDTLNTLVATNVVCHEPAMPSRLLLPVLGEQVGAEETPNVGVRTTNAGPTIVRGYLFLPSALLTTHYSLLTSDGRKVMELRFGANDVGRFSPGVYFVRSEPSAVSVKRSAVGVRKVVITR